MQPHRFCGIHHSRKRLNLASTRAKKCAPKGRQEDAKGKQLKRQSGVTLVNLQAGRPAAKRLHGIHHGSVASNMCLACARISTDLRC